MKPLNADQGLFSFGEFSFPVAPLAWAWFVVIRAAIGGTVPADARGVAEARVVQAVPPALIHSAIVSGLQRGSLPTRTSASGRRLDEINRSTVRTPQPKTRATSDLLSRLATVGVAVEFVMVCPHRE